MQTGDRDPGPRRTAIIVTGMHRSGTSAITRVVSLLGAALPNQLIEGREDNERGFWEGRAVVDLDARLLKRFGSWWGGWDRINPQRLQDLTRLAERARRVIRNEFGDADLIVMKDPRLSRLLPFWTPALEAEGFHCIHIVALRHPGAVVGSLARRNGLSPKATTLSWLAHSLDAELYTREGPRVFVSFENVLRDWRSEADRISRALGIDWPRAPEEVVEAVGEFIEPALVHEPGGPSPKGAVAAVSPVYDVLWRWSRDDRRPDDAQVLDAWRAFLSPIRSQRSAVARMSLDRHAAINELNAQKQRVGRLGSADVWNPIQHHGYNVEAAAAWSWLKRERQQVRAARRAANKIARLEHSIAEDERSRGVLAKVERKLWGRPSSRSPVAATLDQMQGKIRRRGR